METTPPKKQAFKEIIPSKKTERLNFGVSTDSKGKEFRVPLKVEVDPENPTAVQHHA